MKVFECDREQDVLDAVASGRWPARCDESLRAHVAACEACADLAGVARAFLADDDGSQGASAVPPASVVWWRAQIRAREDAAVAAARPLHLAIGAAAACMAALLGLVGVAFAAPIGAWSRGVGDRVMAVDVSGAMSGVIHALAHPGVQLALGVWIVLAPVAVYLALARE